MTRGHEETTIGGSQKAFQPTLWTLVSKTRDTSTTVSRKAFGQLVERYWKPVYFFLRRKGFNIEEAKDLTQGFFSRVLEKDYLKAFDRVKGRFRTFLLTALDHYCANEHDYEQALKRGGGRTKISLDFDSAEKEFPVEPADTETPESIFQRKWAIETIQLALSLLESEFKREGKESHFKALEAHLSMSKDALSQEEIAKELGITVSNVKVILHRARGRLREILKEEVSKTLDSSRDVSSELQFLLESLR